MPPAFGDMTTLVSELAQTRGSGSDPESDNSIATWTRVLTRRKERKRREKLKKMKQKPKSTPGRKVRWEEPEIIYEVTDDWQRDEAPNRGLDTHFDGRFEFQKTNYKWVKIPVKGRRTMMTPTHMAPWEKWSGMRRLVVTRWLLPTPTTSLAASACPAPERSASGSSGSATRAKLPPPAEPALGASPLLGAPKGAKPKPTPPTPPPTKAAAYAAEATDPLNAEEEALVVTRWLGPAPEHSASGGSGSATRAKLPPPTPPPAKAAACAAAVADPLNAEEEALMTLTISGLANLIQSEKLQVSTHTTGHTKRRKRDVVKEIVAARAQLAPSARKEEAYTQETEAQVPESRPD